MAHITNVFGLLRQTVFINGMVDLIAVVSTASGSGGLRVPSNDDLAGILVPVTWHYLESALDEADGNKTRAAKLVGVPSYRTFINWMKRNGVAS